MAIAANTNQISNFHAYAKVKKKMMQHPRMIANLNVEIQLLKSLNLNGYNFFKNFDKSGLK